MAACLCAQAVTKLRKPRLGKNAWLIRLSSGFGQRVCQLGSLGAWACDQGSWLIKVRRHWPGNKGQEPGAPKVLMTRVLVCLGAVVY